MTGLILLVFLATAVIAVPIAHALLVAAMAAAATSDRVPLDLLVQQMVAQVQSFPLIAIPFFMLTGSLMMGGRLGEALIGVLSSLIGRFHGGPGQVGVLSSTIFGGVSGSAVADASAIGSLLIPWQKRLGYPPAFSAATLAAAATIDILRPPSIPMILFALSSNTSVAALFVAGILPGLLMCGGFMAVCWWVGRRRNFPRETRALEWPTFRKQLLYASPALVLPVLIVVFLRFGVATPTEVAVLSTLYAGVISAVVYRDLGLKRLHRCVVEAGLATGVVLLVIMASAAIGWLLTFDHMPDGVVGWAKAHLDRDPADEPADAGLRHVHRPARCGAAAHAGLRATGQRDRHGPGAARHHDDGEPRHWPVHATGGDHAVHHQFTGPRQGRANGARTRALLPGGLRRADAGVVCASADLQVTVHAALRRNP